MFRSAMKRSCVALAFRLGAGMRTSPAFSNPRWVSVTSCASTRLFSTSSFTPPEPPASKGMSVYPDIDLSNANKAAQDSEASKRNGSQDAVFVVNGASRGIGLQFVKSLVDRTEGKVVACCRSPENAVGLNEFINSLDDQSRVQVVPLDMEDQASIEEASALIREKYGRVDVLLNVAGLLGDAKTTPGPERSITKLDRDWVEKTMAVNVIGPVMLCKELAPLMKTKRVGKKKDDEERPVSVIASLSARVGSISDNELGGWYSYRFSKSALNQATRTMAHELKRQGTWTIALHPGTTDTDLSKPFQRIVAEGRLFPVDFTVNQLLDCIDGMTADHSGGLYDWAGKAISF